MSKTHEQLERDVDGYLAEYARLSLNDIRTLRKAGKLCDPNGAGDILDLTRAAQKALLERFASDDESEDTK